MDMISQMLVQLGTTSAVIAVAGYVARTWISNHLESLKQQSAHDLNVQLEKMKADWTKGLARLGVREGYLHERRAKVIESMFQTMLDAEFALQNSLVGWWAHSNRDELIGRKLLTPTKLTSASNETMITRGTELCTHFTEINAALHKNGLYLTEEFIEAVRAAYKPFFDFILAMDYANPPKMPSEFKDLVTVGQGPRNAVIGLFRESLGVV